ncbi:glycosyltransferase [bacterium]|nr:glycosyltransferase [bacterium]
MKDFLTSIYNQSRKPDEIILVDGKSNDGTLEYLKNEEKK